MRRGGILDSRNYLKALVLLKKYGITYRDIGYGFDRYYWYSGLYRVSGDTGHLIYAFDTHMPIKIRNLDYRECPASMRIRL